MKINKSTINSISSRILFILRTNRITFNIAKLIGLDLYDIKVGYDKKLNCIILEFMNYDIKGINIPILYDMDEEFLTCQLEDIMNILYYRKVIDKDAIINTYKVIPYMFRIQSLLKYHPTPKSVMELLSAYNTAQQIYKSIYNLEFHSTILREKDVYTEIKIASINQVLLDNTCTDFQIYEVMSLYNEILKKLSTAYIQDIDQFKVLEEKEFNLEEMYTNDFTKNIQCVND